MKARNSSHVLFVAFSTCALCLMRETTSTPTVKIGVMYSGSGSFAQTGLLTKSLAGFWGSYIVSLGGIGSTGILPDIYYCDVQSSAVLTTSCTNYFIHNVSTSVIISPEGTNALVSAFLTEPQSIPLLASVSSLKSLYVCDNTLQPPCNHNGDRRFQYFIGTSPTASDLLAEYFNVMYIYGARTVSIIQGSDAYNSEICNYGSTYAQQNKMQLVYNTTFPATYTYAYLLGVLMTVKATDADILLYCNRPKCQESINVLQDAQYYPRALMLIQCVESAVGQNGTNSALLAHAMGVSTWDKRIHSPLFQDDINQGFSNRFASNQEDSAQLFSSDFATYSGGVIPTYTQASVMVAFYLIEAAVARSNSTRSADMNAAFSKIYMFSFAGLISVDYVGLVRGAPIIIYQVGTSGALNIISPPALSTSAIVYPAPSWEDRIYSAHPFQTGVELAVLVLFVLCSNAFVGVAVTIFRKRQDADVKAKSWRFTIVSVLGTQLFVSGLLTWGITNSQSQCSARAFLLVIGFAVMMSPVIAKMYRINSIFNSSELTMVKLTDSKTAVVMLAHILPLFLVWALWTGVDPLILTRFVVDPLRPRYDYEDCAGQNGQTNSFLLAVACICSFYLLEVAFLAFITRNVTQSFNETKRLLLVVYVWGFILTSVSVIQFTVTSSLSRSTMFALRSVFLCLASLVYVFMQTWDLLVSTSSTAHTRHLKSQASGRRIAPAASKYDARIVSPKSDQTSTL